MDDLESFVANVVERSSWEKSRRGRKCRFPPKGGLHHTSGDASLETHLEIPNWCHAYKSQSPSSRRTRAAAVEYQIVSQTHRGHSTKHRRCVNENRKRFKQGNYLREIKSRKVASLKGLTMAPEWRRMYSIWMFFLHVFLFFFTNFRYVNLQVPTNLVGRGGALLRKIHQGKTFNLNGFYNMILARTRSKI